MTCSDRIYWNDNRQSSLEEVQRPVNDTNHGKKVDGRSHFSEKHLIRSLGYAGFLFDVVGIISKDRF